MALFDTGEMSKELVFPVRRRVTRTDFALCQAYGELSGDMLSNMVLSKKSKLKLDAKSFASHLRPLMKESQGLGFYNARPTLILSDGSFWIISPTFLNSAGFYLCVPIKCRAAAMERLLSHGAFEGEFNLCTKDINKEEKGKITPADMEIYKNILNISDTLAYLSRIDEREFDSDALYSVYDVESKILDIASFVGCEVDVKSHGSFRDGYLHCKDTSLFCGVMLMCIAERYSVMREEGPAVFVSVSEFDSADRYIEVSFEYDCRIPKSDGGRIIPMRGEYEMLWSLAREKGMLFEFFTNADADRAEKRDVFCLRTRIVFAENPDIGMLGDFKAEVFLE